MAVSEPDAMVMGFVYPAGTFFITGFRVDRVRTAPFVISSRKDMPTRPKDHDLTTQRGYSRTLKIQLGVAYSPFANSV